MSTGSGIAIAGWFLAFVWGCSISANTAAGVVIFGIIIAALVFSAVTGKPIIEVIRSHDQPKG